MTQSPPPPLPPGAIDYGQGSAPHRTNGAAIASLVLGIVGCVPFLIGLLAILFGFIGIRKSRDLSLGGKGLAVAGLILGIISVLGWGGFSLFLGYGYNESKPADAVARQFLQDVTAGNINAALANSTGIPAAQLQTQNTQMAPFGTLQSVSFSSFNISDFNGQLTMRVGGTAAFSNGPRTCTFTLVKIGGVYKVNSYWVQ
jgi:Domain of unknown function (DUF4190)